MEQRELYIVQSMHLAPQLEDTEQRKSFLEEGVTAKEIEFVQRTSRMQYRIAAQIIKDIVKMKWVDSLFFDSISDRYARLAFRSTNDIKFIEELERKVGAKGKPIIEYLKLVYECTRIRGMISAFETEQEAIATLIEKHGYPECVFPTVQWGLENGLLDKNSEEAQHVEREAAKYRKKKKNSESYEEALINAYICIRDREVFNNVSTYTADSGILFMGSMHQLRDFYQPNSGFKVTSIRLYQESFDNFHKRREIVGSNELKYRLRIANREMVPEGIKEIVERNIAQAKAEI